MISTLQRRAASEEGAVLIHVAVAILALMGMLVYVFDFGIVWVSRGQAQNAADAGALSGALARAFDDPADPPVADGIADTSGRQAVLANNVWSEDPGVNMSWACPAGVVGRCSRADVYRNGEFASATLPTIFGPVLGIVSHGVRATATAVVSVGNSTMCMRPFSVADRWVEIAGAANAYDRWIKVGGSAVELDPHDIYNPGTGWAVPADVGAEQILKGGNNPNSDVGAIMPGWFLPVQLPLPGGGFTTGGDDYSEAIATCIRSRVTVGQYLPMENGAKVGPTGQGVEDLIALDPDATFNPATKKVEDSCAPTCAPISPRIVPLAVFDTNDFQWRRASGDWTVCPGGGRCVKVVKILGYFVSHMSGQDVVGYLMTMPGEFAADAPIPAGGDFLLNIRLVR
jgi:hypothetical protein